MKSKKFLILQFFPKKYSISLRITFIIIAFTHLIGCNGISEPAIEPNDIIELIVLDESESEEIQEVIGDGETIITLKAIIPENAKSEFKTVTFKASSGAVFVGVNQNNDSKAVDISGIAKSKLKVPLGDEYLYLSVQIGPNNNLFVREESIKLIGIDQLIKLQLFDSEGNLLDSNLRADGITRIKLEATVLYNHDDFSNVLFKKSGGTFQSINQDTPKIKIDENNQAVIDLILPLNTGKLFLSSEIDGSDNYIDMDKLYLDRAYPDRIILEPEKIEITKTSSNSIKTLLTRNKGKVSIGTKIEFESYQMNENNQKVTVGRFTGLSNVSDSNGEVTVQFKGDTGDIDMSKPVTIRAYTNDDEGLLVESKVNLKVIE